MLGSLLGWKFTLVSVFSGLVVEVLGGFLLDLLGASKWLQPLAIQMQKSAQAPENLHSTKLSWHDRHRFALSESTEIFKKIWLWVILGVGIGAGLHGFVPENWISSHLGQNSFWSVPAAVLLGIPLYSNATAMIPIIETLMQKGLPVGTALAFMLATVGASLPEFIMLKQVLKPRLLVYLFLYFLVAFTLVGWLINALF